MTCPTCHPRCCAQLHRYINPRPPVAPDYQGNSRAEARAVQVVQRYAPVVHTNGTVTNNLIVGVP